MKRFIFTTQPLPRSSSPHLHLNSIPSFSLYRTLPHLLLLLLLLLAFPHPVILLMVPSFLTLSLPLRLFLVYLAKKDKVLPEGTVAGLKGANSSVGGCRPCEGSSVLAGEAGVCGSRAEGKHDNDASLETRSRDCACLAATHRWRGDVRRCGHVSKDL